MNYFLQLRLYGDRPGNVVLDVARYAPAAGLMLFIGQRAWLNKDGPNTDGLTYGQCYVGDWREMGLTQQQYRTAKDKLQKAKLVRFTPINGVGTIATILDERFYDLPNMACHQPPASVAQGTGKQGVGSPPPAPEGATGNGEPEKEQDPPEGEGVVWDLWVEHIKPVTNLAALPYDLFWKAIRLHPKQPDLPGLCKDFAGKAELAAGPPDDAGLWWKSALSQAEFGQNQKNGGGKNGSKPFVPPRILTKEDL